MQLGELQNQIERFENRGVSVVALSVDEPQASQSMIKRLGLSFEIASDRHQKVVKAFGVQNPSTQELAIHAVYIVDAGGEVFYRKVGSRRPLSQELIDAVDAFQGAYPRTDELVKPRVRSAVGFPQNNYQAIITASKVKALPENVDALAFSKVYSLLKQRRSDDALIAFKFFANKSVKADLQSLNNAAAWLAYLLFLDGKPEVVAAGQLLGQRLDRIRELESAIEESKPDSQMRDELTQTLAKARAGLSLARADVTEHADEWRLRSVKTTLRSYRAVAGAVMRVRKQ